LERYATTITPSGWQQDNPQTADSLPGGLLDPATALALLRAEFQREAETPEAGYLTAEQWGESWDMSGKNALTLLTKGIKAGVVQERKYRIPVSTYIRKVRHFKVLAKR